MRDILEIFVEAARPGRREPKIKKIAYVDEMVKIKNQMWHRNHDLKYIVARQGVTAGVCDKCGGRVEKREGLDRLFHVGSRNQYCPIDQKGVNDVKR
jgi:hypothetical protein